MPNPWNGKVALKPAALLHTAPCRSSARPLNVKVDYIGPAKSTLF